MTISSDQNNDWRPWVMPAMTRKPTQPTIKSDVNPSSPSRPTAETLRRALEEIQQARTRAREKGHAKGLRSEEHTSELQSRGHLVCRLLLEKKNYSIFIISMKSMFSYILTHICVCF